MSNVLTTSDDSLEITRYFRAPREAVFHAWTTPASFATWFGGPDICVPLESCVIDAREGGSWKATMILPDDSTIEWTGEFDEVTFPERIAMTFRDQPGPSAEPVTVEFRENDDVTEMKLCQSGGNLDAEGYRQAGAGWMAFFDAMDDLLRSN